MLRKYVNKENKQTLFIPEDKINKTIQLIDMLMIPKGCKTILDKRIEFINDETFQIKDLDNFVFICKEDLTYDLKGLFDFYCCSLPLFIYNELLEKRPDLLERHTDEYDSFTKRTVDKLEKQFCKCMRYKVFPHQFLIKEEYKGIMLYDPLTKPYEDKWSLVEKREKIEIA